MSQAPALLEGENVMYIRAKVRFKRDMQLSAPGLSARVPPATPRAGDEWVMLRMPDWDTWWTNFDVDMALIVNMNDVEVLEEWVIE